MKARMAHIIGGVISLPNANPQLLIIDISRCLATLFAKMQLMAVSAVRLNSSSSVI